VNSIVLDARNSTTRSLSPSTGAVDRAALDCKRPQSPMDATDKGEDRMQHAYGLEIPETLEEVCRPERMALLVYDMQVGIVRHLPDAEAFVARVVRVVEAARRAGVRVIFARHMTLPNELAGVFQLRTAMAWQRVTRVEEVRSLFARDAADYQLVPELRPLSSEAVFDKLAMSMFVGTPLEMVLRDCGINAFAIVGAVTEIGIEPTVRHGADLGFIPVIVADACGSVDAAAGERSLESLAYALMSMQTDVDTITRILSLRP
jgi:biuret amidohydrolase